jgi:hypothetical protein
MLLINGWINAAQQPIQILLTTPRTVSTAFEKSIMSRGDYKVLHEPWESSYMFHHDNHHVFSKMPSRELIEVKNYREVKALIYQYASKSPVFIKDMIWCMAEEFLQDQALLSDPNVQIAFLIRDPAKSMESYFLKSLEQLSPNKSLEWTKTVFRYDALVKIAEKYKQIKGKWPIIIESENLCRNPEETLKAYCKKVNMDFMPGMLAWQPEMHEEWKHFANWHTDAANSSGFYVPKRDETKKRFSEVSIQYVQSLEEIYQEQNPFYEQLKSMNNP